MNRFRAVAAMLTMAAAIVSCGKDDSTTTPTTTEYTVTFDPDGGTPAPGDQTIAKGGKITEPPAMTKTDHTFDGWYKDATEWDFAVGTVTADMTLKARWTPAAEEPQATLRYETVPYMAAVGTRAAGDLDNLVYTDYYDQCNYYFFILGHINSTPLAYRQAIYYNGTTPITVGYSSTNVSESSITKSITEANENSVSKSSTSTWGNEIGVTAGVEAGSPFVKARFEASYGHSWGGSESTDVTTARSFSNTHETSSAKASEITDEISVTIGNKNEPAGLYRFSLFSVTDVYFVVKTDRAKTEIISAEIAYCARPTQFWLLDYDPEMGGSFAKTASGELLQIPDVTVDELPDVAECVHEWGPWITTVDATERTEGEESRACKLCGEIETRVVPVVRTGTFDLSTRKWTSGTGNASFSVSNDALTVNDQAKIVVVTSGTTSGSTIVVNGNAIITLRDVKLTTGGSDNAIELKPGARLTLRLEGNNQLTSDRNAGIRTTGATLTITGPGSLIAKGGGDYLYNGSGAGIGGNGGKFVLYTGSVGEPGGTVIIESGTVTATGGKAGGAYGTSGGGGGGAGIGGGGGTGWGQFQGGGSASCWGGAGGNITIWADANVTANGGVAGEHNNYGHGGGPAMPYGGGGGGGTRITTAALSASQGDPGNIVDLRNP